MKLLLIIVLRSLTSIACLDINDGFSRTIVVDSNFKSRTCTKTFDWHCPSIQEAFQHLVDNTSIILKDNQVLSENQTLKNINGLLITGSMDNISLTCIKNNTGIFVDDCKNISFTRITIQKCGLIKTEDDVRLSAALYFKRVTNVSFFKVGFTGNIGYSTVLFESSGEASFSHVIYENNSIPASIQFGGGVLIIQKNSSFIASISFKDCIFRFNSGYSNYLQSNADSFILGSGLSVAFRGASKNNALKIISCQFLNNTGIFGAGFLLLFIDFSNNNIVLVKNTTFTKNRAVLQGGAFRIYNSIPDSNINNEVGFTNCNFSHNHAPLGGALSHYSETIMMNVSYSDCVFYCNNGTVGQSIYAESSNLVFSSVNVSEKPLSPQNLPSFVGYAALFALYCKVFFRNYNYITLISNTAIVLDMSDVIINGELHLWNNNGVKGAALALFEHSRIHVQKNATMTVLNCTAFKGGGIYVESTGPFGTNLTEDLLGYSCFMNIEKTGSVTFRNNTSLQDGENDIFVTSLRNCMKSGQSLSVLQKKFGTRLIVTNPITLQLNSSDWKDKYPGELFKPSLFLRDELNNPVSTVVDVVVDDSAVCYSTFVANNSIEFVLTGEPRTAFTVAVYFENVVAKLRGDRKYCPFAYSYSKGKKECVCSNAKNRKKGLFCNADGSVSILDGMYANISERGVAQDAETTYPCPQGYCKPCDRLSCNLNTSDSNQQCNSGRHGYLCSVCSSNTTVALGSERCLPRCGDYNWLLWLLLFFAGIFLFTCFCMVFLNVCIYENWINSFIYFYQVLPYHLSKNVFNQSPLLCAITGIISFNGLQQNRMTNDICLFNDWNNLDKTFFNYFFPVCLFVSLIIISNISCLHQKLIEYSKRVQRVLERNAEAENTHLLKVFTAILIFTYADITRISLAILQPVKFPGEPDRPYVYAVHHYGDRIHGFYMLIAVLCILLIVIGFPLVLMTNFWKQWRFFKIIARQHGMLESFRGKFADDFRVFVSFYFFSQLLIIILSKFARDEFVTLTSTVLFVTFATCFPFKDQATNYFDSFLLFLLALFAILRDGTFPILNDKLYYKLVKVLDCATFSLVFLPCLIVPVRWFFRFMKPQIRAAPHNAMNLENEPLLINENVADTHEVQWTK